MLTCNYCGAPATHAVKIDNITVAYRCAAHAPSGAVLLTPSCDCPECLAYRISTL